MWKNYSLLIPDLKGIIFYMKPSPGKKKLPVHSIPNIPTRLAYQYAGKTAAVINGKVVAAGKNTQDAIRNALKKYPKVKEWEVGIMSIPPRDGVWIV